MRSTRIAVSAALLGALALPVAATATATAAPAATPHTALAASCTDPGPWVIATQAVNIRSKASTSSTIVGVLYRGHRFTVSKTSGAWHYITDKTTGVKGWVSDTYVYQDTRMCLD
ncbi:SH3 domain-containing protein [Streptomyces sp. NPDC004690]